MKNKTLPLLLTSALISALALQACSPAPRHDLSSDEKTADMYWLYSQFGENYAPLEMKQDLYGYKFEDLKATYLDRAKATTSNEAFYATMYSFVAEFRDGHTSAALNASRLPGRDKVGYLGFSGVRKGDNLLVTEILPTSVGGQIEKGDKIKKINGMSLPEYIKKNITKIRNVGNDNSNITYLMDKIFNRSSLHGDMPTEDSAVLVVERNSTGKDAEITLPWIVKDLAQFNEEQDKAKKKSDGGDEEKTVFSMAQTALNTGDLSFLPTVFKRIDRAIPGFDFLKTFQFVDDAPTLTSSIVTRTAAKLAGVKADAVGDMKKARNVPSDVIFIKEAVSYPAYISMETIKDKDGKETDRKKMVGNIYIDSFEADASAVDEVKSTLRIFASYGVKDIIVDMINNGGGSLDLGMKLAQLFNPKKIEAPGIQFRLSETWLDEFQKKSLDGSDSERELARRVFAKLTEDKGMSRRLSRVMSIEELFPFSLNGNDDLKAQFNVVLMVNEMCASMCDIFSAVLQDNKMATIVGSQTMGAGGNVVNHYESPNAHLQVRQTESLMVRTDGSYIENHGIMPDVKVDVNNYSGDDKYDQVRQKAVDVLVTEKAETTTLASDSDTDTE